MAKQFTLKYVGDVTVTDKAVSIIKEDGTNCMLDSDYSVFVTKPNGHNMLTWMTFERFIEEMSNEQVLHGDALQAFDCWVEMFYVQCHLDHEPTCTLDELLWEKTYEFDNAVTPEERAVVIGGWHVFTDGKEYAVIWDSECHCKTIVPLLGKEIVFMNDEVAVIKL